MPGFWESFNQNMSGAFDNYERMKQLKRQRAIEKLRFLTENADVGSPVDPALQKDIQDYAPEGNSVIQDGAYVGSPDQQRDAEFRQYMETNPDASPEEVMTRGAVSGAVKPNAYGTFMSAQAAREQRKHEFEQRQQQQRELQDDRQQHALNMRGMIQAFVSRNDGDGSSYGTKADTQKWAANRKTFAPYGGPYNYITQHLLNDPVLAKEELMQLDGVDDTMTLDKPDIWNKYLAYLGDNMTGIRDEFGMKNEELRALMDHVTGIRNKRQASNAGSTLR